MSLIAKKELEIAQAENRRLQAELERLNEGRAFDRTTIETLKRVTNNFRERLLPYQEEVGEKASEIAHLRDRVSEVGVRPHNERGAGRKRKAVPEHVELIRALQAAGKSYASIAKTLSEQTGDVWNKTTVRDAYLTAGN